MHWLHDFMKIGLGGLGGIALGMWIARKRKANERLFRCYVNYFDLVLAVAVEIDATAAQSMFSDLSEVSRQLELLETDARCVMSTGLLFARCHKLVATLSGACSATSAEIAALRRQISEEYAATLRLVRPRFGSARELIWRTHSSEVEKP